MPFTAEELANISNAMLDYHMDRGKIFSQTIQDKPLLSMMRRGQKTFPGGKGALTVRVKGEYNSYLEGYSHDDTVSYGNPANIRQASYDWYETHGGLKITMTELKMDGITVVDSANGKNTVQHTEREKTALANLLEDKIEDMAEGFDRDMNDMYWKDGTQDSKLVPGIRSLIVDDPTAATVVGGIDQSANSWWRNRASLSIDASTPSNQNLVNTLQNEVRQLRRYSKGSPRHRWLAGSDFIEALEKEVREKGNYSDTGFMNEGQTDAGMADIRFKGNPIMYDPTLDDLGLSKYLFVIDGKVIYPMVMDGEDMKRHNPARPENQYVIHRAVTWTGGLVCRQRNTSGVYSIA